jgi:anti-sigma B factor antagonist
VRLQQRISRMARSQPSSGGSWRMAMTTAARSLRSEQRVRRGAASRLTNTAIARPWRNRRTTRRGESRLAATPTSSPLPRLYGELGLETRHEARATVITLSGELDLATSPTLECELDRVQSSEVGLVMLDLRGLEFMDCSGLAVVVSAHARAAKASGPLALVNVSQQIQRLMQLTGVAEQLTIANTAEELLAEGES